MPSLANLHTWIAHCWERRSLHKLFFFLTVLSLTSYGTGNTDFLPFLCLSVLVCKMEAIKIESIPQVLRGLKRATKCKVLRTMSDPQGAPGKD